MGSRGDDEEQPAAVPLLAAAYPTPSGLRRSHAGDVHLLSAAFLFVFSAYLPTQNLQSTLNTEGNLGAVSMGILYASFTVFTATAAAVVRRLGSRGALVVCTSGYALFILANLLPTWYTMVPASVYLGFTSSLMWVGQVIGNLISLVVLGNDKDGGGANKNLLFTVFLGCMVVGIVLMCLLSRRDESRGESDGHEPQGRSFLADTSTSAVTPLADPRMLLLAPLLAYYGLQKAFVWAVFTKSVVTPVLGVAGVGGAMAVYGAAGVVSLLVAGRLTSGLRSSTFIVSTGAVLQAGVLLWLLFFYCPMLGSAAPLVVGAVWGVGDGILNTQLSALIGLLFENDKWRLLTKEPDRDALDLLIAKIRASASQISGTNQGV
ncbi:UNC93-like protein 3 isoform X2 [Triticum dicoccoides]|uniref:UNC93-like protein 3 isoform X2 n=1 Tax=Triticum dicoccoides TaxID=85692 RepID=UPI0018902D87|nr:UNC93-like protein 3 isoform X2 [Triticum dicoccoides]